MVIASYAYILFEDASIFDTGKCISMHQLCRPKVVVFIKYFVMIFVKQKLNLCKIKHLVLIAT